MSWFNPFSWGKPQPSQPFKFTESPQAYQQALATGNIPNGGGALPATPSSDTSLGGTYSGTSGGGGSTGGTSGGTSTANANGGSSSFLNDTYLPAISNLQNTYNNIFNPGGVYDQAVGQAAGNLQKSYGAQQGGLDTQYAQSQRQLPWEYGARGLGSSSFNENANNDAAQQYNNSTSQIQAAEAKDVANLYQQEKGLSGQYQGYLNAFNDPTYQAMLSNAPSYIQSEAYNNILQDVGQLNYTQGANTPLNQSLSALNSNPTYADNGSQIIKQQLDALANSGTTAAAQNQIAQGIISNPVNPQNQSYWNDYWRNLQNGGLIPTGPTG